jgi:inner membrane protein
MQAYGISPSDVLWGQAFLAVGISDLRGIQQDIPLSWNGHSLVFQPGVNGLSTLPSGMFAAVPLGPSQRTVNYSFDLKLNGSGRLSFVPTGKTTTVHLGSAWTTPSFDGNFLPQSRQVGEKGFTADWKVFYMSRSFPQAWRGNQVEWNSLEATAFGASFLYPVDAYQKVTRSAKYGALYILLTFGVFFLFEILLGLRVHSIQYILVGSAIILFYLLLLSLSDYMAFGGAYALACVGIITLITGYSRSVLCDWRKAGVIGSLMSVLYGILYVLLRSEDYALLLGSVGLFAALAAAMYVTRNVDWYEVGPKSLRAKR